MLEETCSDSGENQRKKMRERKKLQLFWLRREGVDFIGSGGSC